MIPSKKITNNSVDLHISTFMQEDFFILFKSALSKFEDFQFNNFQNYISLVENYILKDVSLLIIDADYVGKKIFDLIKIVRSEDIMSLNSAPILILTSGVSHKRLESLVTGGCNDSLLKPFTPRVLHDKIINLISLPHSYKLEQGQAKPQAHFSYMPVEVKPKTQELWVV